MEGPEVCDYWKARVHDWEGNLSYECPNGCTTNQGNTKKLKPKLSKSAKNPNRWFLSCNDKSYNGSKPGCGLFCWCDEEPNEQALSKRQAGTYTDAPSLKRARVDNEGTVVSGSGFVNMPDQCHKDIAKMSAQLDAMQQKLDLLVSIFDKADEQ